MIPIKLTLKNFLSYREATLDFRGLHTACICGANGAGKSSLLEAITWVIWGKSRTESEDDAIHGGASDVRVDFIFQNNEEVYRIIRTKARGQSSCLEFQIDTGESFRSLTEKGVRATQQLILHHIKLDYETFINSAYLRQGRADEFMIRRPAERKQILVDLLKLDRYEELAAQAKDLSKQFKVQAEQIEQNLIAIAKQLEEGKSIGAEQELLKTTLAKLQRDQETDQKQLQDAQGLKQQRYTWEQQLTFVRQQYQNLSQDCDRIGQDIVTAQAQQEQLWRLISQSEQINTGYTQYINLQKQDEILTTKFQAYQVAQQERQELQQQLTQDSNDLNRQIQQTQAQIEGWKSQEQEIQDILSRAGEVSSALAQFKNAKKHLQELDNLQLEASPLMQRRTNLQSQLERAQTKLTAKLEELHLSETQLSTQIATTPQLRDTVLQVESEIEQLEKKKVHQQRVQEKGVERRHFQERLQENQRRYEKQIGEISQKIEMLKVQDAICPLCERPLDENHSRHVIDKTDREYQEVQEQFWMIREQLAVCERELQVLRQEYTKLSKELAPYESLLEQRGQLEARLEATDEAYDRLYDLAEEKKKLEKSLERGLYAMELQEELREIEAKLAGLNYNEETHALARGELDRWRWAEIKNAKLEDAQRRQAKIDAQKPQLEAKLDTLKKSLEELQTKSPLKQKLDRLDWEIREIDYNLETHNQLRASLRQATSWQLRYQELVRAEKEYPQNCDRISSLTQTLTQRRGERDEINRQLELIIKQIEKCPDPTHHIRIIEDRIQSRRRQLDEQLSLIGRYQQRLNQLESLEIQYGEQQEQIQVLKKQYRIYEQLAIAFGKNGIPTLMIENILPQLEAQTNQILSRLTGNQFHVQFVTQKAGRRATKKSTKMIDTLDILIADAKGTRAYETYSGGEAFRINFSIRLALAQLLAQQAGTSLQMLIVDEGFGTQDPDGCDRLIAAINAIASDFSCILTVTHMPQFKEAFQTRIEVIKTEAGSQLRLSM
ncbi:MAG TPA: ATP-binding cassette family protein [Cyanobacteria bacterium UBA11149]|nr:ATP-binding cassette family protein [Cyanobacteria bacterium UBA11367]HBE59701.1 ATP-binding cassette family protein [Cyanobacteria bacterium UBA11366]HBK63278.1 ATP-binding cassette family protein [Cyanobacteria bacterium UBA11166]HBR76588.1 ATP-binding cassette family protein [Cyanobacteria bacterium UBA11159]HBS69509.1 ATP-binding cassette family protein [Cyanobacteria bacterium UBA11153]HBW90716.1 ATP-binding cassette family protein [Cyanobacteria bacterium UBA11149]HCA97315.1 ATP-bind